MAKLILASASPRRRELLEQIGVHFQVRPVDIDETISPNESAYDFVERLAREKALAGLSELDDQVVLGADTVVVHGGQVMGKPTDQQQSLQMLQQLSDSEHQVLTAVALASKDRIESIVVATTVRFNPLDPGMCEKYWATGEPQDKAGSYGIQGLGAVFVANIEGSYSSVVGLPLAETAQLLKRFDIATWQPPVI